MNLTSTPNKTNKTNFEIVKTVKFAFKNKKTYDDETFPPSRRPLHQNRRFPNNTQRKNRLRKIFL